MRSLLRNVAFAYLIAAVMIVTAVWALTSLHFERARTNPCAHGAKCDPPVSELPAIHKLLTQQSADWNRGDLNAFASGYKNSPDILFIGRRVSHGYEGMLAGYKKGYPTHEAMGTLTFSGLEVQPLDPNFATATGHYHLERSATGGGNADGYFLLVLERTMEGWKIVRDDTTSLPAVGASH